jgi:hypothetical protein
LVLGYLDRNDFVINLDVAFSQHGDTAF